MYVSWFRIARRVGFTLVALSSQRSARDQGTSVKSQVLKQCSVLLNVQACRRNECSPLYLVWPMSVSLFSVDCSTKSKAIYDTVGCATPFPPACPKGFCWCNWACLFAPPALSTPRPNATRVDEAWKGRSPLATKMKGTNRSGDGVYRRAYSYVDYTWHM